MKLANLAAAAACCAAAFPTVVFARGTFVVDNDVQPRVAGGKIVTDAIDDASGGVTPNVRHFGYEFGEDPKDPYFLQDPGFVALAGSGLPGGSVLSFNVERHLAYWNGAGRVSFTTPPSGETLRFNLGPSDVTIGGASAPQPGFAIATVGPDGTLHRHLNTFLQGPAGGGTPVSGVYFTNVRLLSSAGSVAPSDALYMIFNNGASKSSFDAALHYLTEPLPGDANFDGAVNLADFNILAANFGAADRFWYQGDFNGDGRVNLQDFNLLAGHFGQNNATPGAAVPEPSSAALVSALVSPLLLARRRRAS
jgi:hypothetical protein